MKPLKNIRVLDLSRILAGPFASMQLADLGAEVIKIEPFTGDETRKWGPPYLNGNSDISTYYLSINRNKKSIAVDLKKPEGLGLIKSLAERSDIFLENFGPGVSGRLGVSYKDIKEVKPNIVYGSIKGYGSEGKLANETAFDSAIQAFSGFMSINGDSQNGPYKVGVAIIDILTGLYLTNAVISALYHRDKTNEGCEVEISMLEAALSSLANISSSALNSEFEIKRLGNAHPSIVPYSTFKTKDSIVMICCGTDGQFQALCDVIDLPSLKSDQRFSLNSLRSVNREELLPQIEEKLLKWTTEEFLIEARKRKIPCSPVNTVKEAISMEEVKNSSIETMKNSSNETARFIRSPFNFKGFPRLSASKFPPKLSEDRDDILRSVLNISEAEIGELIKKKIII